jgi:7-carboxy-7-deazaguanine synthase
MSKPMSAVVSEIFGPTIQGEGPKAGHATVFIRFFGCDSRCGPCDSMHAVDSKHPGAGSRKNMTFADIAAAVHALDPSGRLPVTFSGGNPAAWALQDLISMLRPRQVWVETQGTMFMPWASMCDLVVVSPKGPGMRDSRHGVLSMSHLAKWLPSEIVGQQVAFKVVCFGSDDLDYAADILRFFPSVTMYLSVGNANWQEGANSSEPSFVREQLADRYAWLCEEVVRRSDLHKAIVLPQLHVLAWGDARGR